MATSVPGYSYNVNRSVNDELNFPGVVFTLGTPYVKVNETAKSCEITTKTRTNSVYQVIGQKTIIPVNTVFKYIANSYDFGTYNARQTATMSTSTFLPTNTSGKFGYYIYDLYLRRYLGDIIPSKVSSGRDVNLSNYYLFSTDAKGTFVSTNMVEGSLITGTYNSLFNGVAKNISITSTVEYIDVKNPNATDESNAMVEVMQCGTEITRGTRVTYPTFYSDSVNSIDFSAYLGIKSITIQSTKDINPSIYITPANITGSINNSIVLTDFNKTTNTDNITYKFTVPNPEKIALVSAAKLRDNVLGKFASSANETNPVTYKNFYDFNVYNPNTGGMTTIKYNNLDASTLRDVNLYDPLAGISYGHVTYGSPTSYDDSSNNVFFALNYETLAEDKQMQTYYSQGGEYINTIIPLGKNIHSKSNGPGLHLFANIFTNYTSQDSTMNNAFGKDFANIEIQLESPVSYEDSIDKQTTVNIVNIELGVYYIDNRDRVNIYVAGSKRTAQEDGASSKPSDMNEIRVAYNRFDSLKFNFAESVPGFTLDDVAVGYAANEINEAGYCMANVSSTFYQNDGKTTGDIPYNKNICKNVQIVGDGVTTLACKTAKPLIKIDKSSLTIDGYSVMDLNGYVKNVLSSDKHIIKFNITAADGIDESTNMPYGDVILGVKPYDISDFNNASFNDGKYLNLPTVKYETSDKQYVSYLLKINSNYIQDTLIQYNTKANISNISITGSATYVTEQDNVNYYKLERGKSATIAVSISNINTDDLYSNIARVFDICVIVNKYEDYDPDDPDYTIDNILACKFFLSGISNDDIIDKTDVVGYSEAGGIGTMFIQEGIKKSEDVPFLFDSDETEQDIINVGDELPSEPLDQAMKLALNYRDLSIKVMPYTLVNYINTYSGAGTIESTGEMKDKYKPYLYDWHVNDGLCLDKDTFVIDLYETSSKCTDTRYWGTYKSTMSFIKSTLYERLDKMNPFEPIVS